MSTRSAEHIIFDVAAALLSQEPVADPGADESRLTRVLRAHLTQTAEEVAQEFDWPSCRARVLLVAEAPDPAAPVPPPFTARHPLPDDYLRLLDFADVQPAIAGRHTVEIDGRSGRRVLLADFEPGWLIYARLPPLDRLDPLLRAAIAARLAQRVARTITESDGRAREIEAQAQQAFDRAVAATVFERSADLDVAPSWADRMWGRG
jgi:hypothetical protein